jgi:hypothetical protein
MKDEAQKTEWMALMLYWSWRHMGCDVCGDICLGPMVNQNLWDRIAINKRELLCGSCMVIRLGRLFKSEELWNVPWNEYRKAFFEGIDPHVTQT